MGAATVDADITGGEEDPPHGPVTFTAGKSERNALTISPVPGGLVFRDVGAALDVHGDCRRRDRHTAWCPYTLDDVTARLGDGADEAHLIGHVWPSVHGGPGADVLRAGRSGARLHGGSGADVVRGGPGGDALTGGLGRDLVEGGGGGDNLIDGEPEARAAPDRFLGGSAGGPSDAVIDYGRRTRRLRVDLARGTFGTEDVVRDVDGVVGGRGNDRLVGDRRRNYIDGGPGDDTVDGRGGDDVIVGGPGGDRLSGGAGEDWLSGQDEPAAHDVINCHGGRDLIRSDVDDLVGPTCEKLEVLPNRRLAIVPAIDADSVDFRIRCPGADDLCDGRLVLTALDDYTILGATDFDLGTSVRWGIVSVPLEAAAAAKLQSRTAVQVKLRPRRGREGLFDPTGYSAFMKAPA